MIDAPMRPGLVLVGLLMLAGCGGVPRVPEDSFYRLDTAAPMERLAEPVLKGVLSVQVVAATPLYRDRALLYSEQGEPHKLQRYHYHYWVDTPPRLLQRGLADYLRSAGIAAAVVTPDDGIDERYRLRLDLVEFDHMRDKNGGKVRVGMDMVLSERAEGALLMRERLQTEAAVRGGEFSAVAAAYRQALTELHADVLERLRSVRAVSP